MNNRPSQIPPEEHVLAIDASPYAIRAALTDAESSLIDSFEGKPAHPDRLVHFIERRSHHSAIQIVASPLDQWPPGLHAELQANTMRWRWLQPIPLRHTLWHLAPWQRKQRLLRARLLGHLAKKEHFYHIDAARLAIEWQHSIIKESMEEIRNAAAAHHIALE